MPISPEHKLTSVGTLLMRQVHPSQMQEGRPASRSFTPNDADGGHLSADDDTFVSPKIAYERYLAAKNLEKAGGTWAVSVGEFAELGLSSYADPLENNSAHVLVDFTTAGNPKQYGILGKAAYSKAILRGRLFPAM